MTLPATRRVAVAITPPAPHHTRSPPQLPGHLIILHSNTPHGLHKYVGALLKLILAVHPGLRVQASNPDPLISFSTLRLLKDFGPLHREVLENWNYHHATMLFYNMFPQWFVNSLFLQVLNIIQATYCTVLYCTVQVSVLQYSV